MRGSLNPEQMDKDLQEAWRALFKASKALAEYPECRAVADEVYSGEGGGAGGRGGRA